MAAKKYIRKVFLIFSVLSVIFFIGTLYIYLDSYYFLSYRTVKSFSDPRWRIFDYNSRQATEGDIYNVAEVPAIKKVYLSGNRKLRFKFIPGVRAKSWKIVNADDRSLISDGVYPEIQFPDTSVTGTYVFIPEGVTLASEMAITISFYPEEGYHNKGLSWPDNYYTPSSEIPFNLKKTYSIDEWAGIPDNDPEIIEAKRIMGNSVDMNAPALIRSEQVYSFIMSKIAGSKGTPSDEVQEASPHETYIMLSTGKGKGWCENNALVYYLFANAVGVKTRLIDRAGKFGPLKLTGHYFCESWIPEYAGWMYVDPQINIAHVTNRDGTPLHIVDLKKLVDIHALTGCTFTTYDTDTGALITKDGEDYYNRIKSGLTGEIVFAYKFGYGNNKTFSKCKNFLCHTTLLYAPFTLPKLYLVKYFFLYGFLITFIFTVISGFGTVVLPGKGRRDGIDV